MRRDPVTSPSSPDGNLWLLFSHPQYDLAVLNGNAVYTGAVEIHLAASPDGGNTWTPNSPPAIWPSAYCMPSAQCTKFGLWSSHEVANFWPYNNNGTPTWYAAHLMYYVQPTQPGGIPSGINTRGCIVTTVAQNTPANSGQGWPSGQVASVKFCPTGIVPPFQLVTGQQSSRYGVSYASLTALAAPHGACSGSSGCVWGNRHHGHWRDSIPGCILHYSIFIHVPVHRLRILHFQEHRS